MEKPNLKIIIFITVAVLTVVLVVLSVLSRSPKREADKQQVKPTPTLSPPGASESSSSFSTKPVNNLTPTLIPVDPFTGVRQEEQTSKEESDLATQKRELRKKTPLSEAYFSLAFDYSADMFVVTLKEPKNSSKALFTQWLKSNYPLIPLDRFEFK